MSQSALRSHRPQPGTSPVSLRIFDRRYSRLLSTMPDPTAESQPVVDIAGWVAADKPLVAPGGNLSPTYLRIKRACDVVGALALFALFAPIMLPTWLVLFITTRGHPTFRQTRVGQCGRRFQMYKFRTMRIDAHLIQPDVRNEQTGPVFKNRRDPRVTRLGIWLRRLSIDEMPQIVNVLRGEMSLVGPRPPIPAEVTRYEPWQIGRLSVKPGLTCVWQVSGRCEIQFHDWVRLDLWYVQHQSLAVDLWLLLRTPWSVLTCRGAY